MTEGFLRSPVDLGLSKVDTDDPETSDGVRSVGGGNNTLLWRERVTFSAGSISDGWTTEVLFDTAFPLCPTTTGVGVIVVLFVLCSALSAGPKVLLALFANLETCCAALLGLLVTLLLLGFVGMRLDGLRCDCVEDCSCCG